MRRDKVKDKRAESIGEVDLSELKFPIIAIYRHPADYPNKYVARVFDITRPTDTVVVKDSLQELQKDISRNVAKSFIPRDEKDDPFIIGSWI